MDADRFDALTRAVGRATSRRNLFRTIAGVAGILRGTVPRIVDAAPFVCSVPACRAAVTAVHSACADGCKDDDLQGVGPALCVAQCEVEFYLALKTCETTGGCFDDFERCCSSRCLDVRSDPEHCGSCDVRCGAGQPCCAGVCRVNDIANCGSCGNICPRSASGAGHCINGKCQLCAPNEVECNSGGAIFCVDLQTSSANCGKCGKSCQGTQLCCNGTCTADVARCGGVCVSTICPVAQLFDPEVCRCGCAPITCDTGMHQDRKTCRCVCDPTCLKGLEQDEQTCACACPDGQTECDSTCVDLLTDATNCGTCGGLCDKGHTCQNGTCLCPATKPDLCNGVCTSFNYNPATCGGCQRINVCTPGLPDCCPGPTIKTGICTNKHFDGNNCGWCGHACPGGRTCQSGTCLCPAGMTECHGRCVAGSKCDECGEHELACGDACCLTGLACSSAPVAMTGSGLRAFAVDAPICVCPDSRLPCGGACCAPTDTCTDDTCIPRVCAVCEIELEGECFAVSCDPGQTCVNDSCVPGSGDDTEMAFSCPPDWLDCNSFCCPPGNYYCGGGCCFDPGIPCFPAVPKLWPALTG